MFQPLLEEYRTMPAKWPRDGREPTVSSFGLARGWCPSQDLAGVWCLKQSWSWSQVQLQIRSRGDCPFSFPFGAINKSLGHPVLFFFFSVAPTSRCCCFPFLCCMPCGTPQCRPGTGSRTADLFPLQISSLYLSFFLLKLLMQGLLDFSKKSCRLGRLWEGQHIQDTCFIEISYWSWCFFFSYAQTSSTLSPSFIQGNSLHGKDVTATKMIKSQGWWLQTEMNKTE